jgi:uncharacterized protein YecE (DUF72 family)
MTATPGAEGATGRGLIRIGISSWGDLPGFYPARIKASEKLTWYARFFSVVEVNVSYYRIVPQHTYGQWLDATPDDLIFDIKAFGELTHFRKPPPERTFDDFRASYAPLRDAARFGGALFQFPPRFENSPIARAYLQRVADQMNGDQVIIEFRNYTWLTADTAAATFELLRDLGLAYAIADEPQIPNDTVPPLPEVTDSGLAYVRFHGRNAATWYRRSGGSRYDYDYSDEELSGWAKTVSDLARRARQVHVMFNNNARGAGTRNAISLGRMLGVAPADTPQLPLAQSRLFAEEG